MSAKSYTIQEVEHENLVLGHKLIEVYEKRIAILEEENRELRLKLTQAPPYSPSPGLIPNKRKISTISELRELLEIRSAKVLGEAHEVK